MPRVPMAEMPRVNFMNNSRLLKIADIQAIGMFVLLLRKPRKSQSPFVISSKYSKISLVENEMSNKMHKNRNRGTEIPCRQI